MNLHRGFNPRAQRNSNALSDFVLEDLRRASSVIDKAIESGRLNQKKNAEVYTKVASRNVDLVLHTGNEGPAISVLTSVENKSIMAAHGKARKNRYGDLIAYANHMHNHRRDCIAAGLVVVNVSPIYENPDTFAKGLVRAKLNMQRVVSDTVGLFAGIPLRSRRGEPNDQPEALGLILVDYDGVNLAKLVTRPPAPEPDSQLRYDNFVRRVATLYEQRFGQKG
jgi:hypothetical protein